MIVLIYNLSVARARLVVSGAASAARAADLFLQAYAATKRKTLKCGMIVIRDKA